MLRISLELPLDHPVALQLLDQLRSPTVQAADRGALRGPSRDLTTYDDVAENVAENVVPAGAETETPPKRGRGRPRKNPQPETLAAAPAPAKPGAITITSVSGTKAVDAGALPAATITKDDVRAAIQRCGAAAGPETVQGLFAKFKIAKVSDLAEARYPEFIAALDIFRAVDELHRTMPPENRDHPVALPEKPRGET